MSDPDVILPRARRASQQLPHSFHAILDHIARAPRREQLALMDEMIRLPLSAHGALINFINGKWSWAEVLRYGYRNHAPLD